MAAHSAVPEACITNGPATAHRAAVASGDRTAKKATAAMTTRPGRCCCGL